MKTLIVYYSRTGHTRMVAENIADKMDGDIEEIIDTQNRNGIIGYLKSGYQASRKKTTQIQETNHDPSAYDLVIIGTPVWAGKMAVPIRAYLDLNKNKIKDLAIFSTYGGSGFEKTIEDIALYTAKVPQATLGIRAKEINNEEYQGKIDNFTVSLSK
jgi:flavodoxin